MYDSFRRIILRAGRYPRAGIPGSAGRWTLSRLAPLLALLVLPAASLQAEFHLADCREMLRTGRYAECLRAADAELRAGHYGEDWYLFKIEALLALGQYQTADKTLEAGLLHYPQSIRLRWLGRTVCRFVNDHDRGGWLTDEIEAQVRRTAWRYTDGESLVILGQVALAKGADPKQVLTGFYDRAVAQRSRLNVGYLAIAELGLTNHDPALAVETLEPQLAQFADDPEVHFALACGYENSNSEKSATHLARVLEINPHHIGALLMKVEAAVDAERYAEARQLLGQVADLNPHEPQALAYRALLAHLDRDPRGETAFRDAALAHWRTNPAVDHIIGRKLSQKYRFTEGALYQRRALAFDPKYLPAKMQLAQDLLRLGQEEEGWELATETFGLNEYNLAAFNLITLQENLEKFRTLQDDDFIVRMEAREAEIYGPRVLALLHRAKQTLCTKYGLELTDPITVEIFPDPSDFAVRTFGMPMGSGYLGVCFGKVITANSPASQAEHPANWEAVLWHEFCHVVTLELTHNRLPRWISEGISVYEERRENPAWGQGMNPTYKAWILEGHLTPISELSGAFLAPPSGLHLQFAYFQSSLVIEFLVEEYGLETLTKILHDLGAGMPVNEAISRHTTDLPALEFDFTEFAYTRARQWAPLAEWEQDELAAAPPQDRAGWEAWVKAHPRNIPGLKGFTQELIKARDWEAAIRVAEQLIAMAPEDTSDQNGYLLRAELFRHQDDAKGERHFLEQHAARTNQDLATFARLIELAAADQDWNAVKTNALRWLAVNPLRAQPHRALMEAEEQLGNRAAAIAAGQSWLLLDDSDPAAVHYRLARLLHAERDPSAKRHALQALEAAPRFRAAQQLILDIHAAERAATSN